MKLHAVPRMAYREREEVAGSRWDLALFVLGLAAILAVLALASPVPA